MRTSDCAGLVATANGDSYIRLGYVFPLLDGFDRERTLVRLR